MSSSDTDDDDAELERIRSVVVDSAAVSAAAFREKSGNRKTNVAFDEDQSSCSNLKFYQARARDLLYKYLDNTFEFEAINSDKHVVSHVTEENDGFHLFDNAPPGLSDKCNHGERTRAKRSKNIDEDSYECSEEFRSCISAAAIDGVTVKATAERAVAKVFSAWLLDDAVKQEAQRKEEERVALLKAQRGEKWLPSVARDMASEKMFEENLLRDVENSRTRKQVGTWDART